MLEDANKPKKRTFRTFQYRGVDLDKLLDLSQDELIKLFKARQRRKFQRGISKKAKSLLKKIRKSKKNCEPGEKPNPVPTHLRNMTIIPEMVGSIVAVHNGKQYTNVEIKPEMIGYYLGEFSITYKHTRHGKPGIGATHSSRFIPLK
ncbi:40S ribosomal protein S15 [Plasmodium falciparum IGH-CR14]|uniref:Ribosomal protein S19 n=2 Tax=Plasmodium falciparum TaxID=5833 RepID=A0A024VMY8_PLAFA|nr:ribosomal protein S19 [Plasmodium falciparum FCH/4]KNG75448.1 40S ribosomal protein S15 [Plasmodium falciparum IGH-CR14]